MSDLKSILQPAEPHRHKLSARQVGQYRRWATIAVDASVLLNLYAYVKPIREDFLRILESLEDRLWLPHQAALEYARNRGSRIQRHIEFSRRLRDLLSSIPGDFRKAAEKKHPHVGRKPQYPFLAVEQMEQRVIAVTERISGELIAAEKEYKDFLDDDPVQDRLNEISLGRIGDPLSSGDLQLIYDEGLKRYDLERPPGYGDADKPGERKYGDLVLWQQLILRAKETGHAVYFITDDTKDDWWQEMGDGVFGPRDELVEEMNEQTAQRFLISTSGDFYEWAGDYLGRRARKSAIAEARRLAVPMKWDAVTETIREMQRATMQMLSLPYLDDCLERLRETVAAAGADAQLQLAAFAEEVNRSVRAAISLPSFLPLLDAYRLGKPEARGNEGEPDEEED
jgi:hypothetical protein